MSDVHILAAVRTPLGRLGGALSRVGAPDLAAAAIRGACTTGGVAPADVAECVLGFGLPHGLGPAPARTAATAAGVPAGVPAYAVLGGRASGLLAVVLAVRAVTAGARLAVAGGADSVSRSPFLLPDARAGSRLGHSALHDPLMHDALAGTGAPPPDAEAQSKTSLDRARSHPPGAELVPVEVPDKKRGPQRVVADEAPGAALAPGHAAPMDGAAVALLGTRQGPFRIVAAIAAPATGDGLVGAIRAALAAADWKNATLDVVTSPEDRAADRSAVLRSFGFAPDRVNPRGGGLARGLPPGAAGALALVECCAVLAATEAQRGLACAGTVDGDAVAVCVERSA